VAEQADKLYVKSLWYGSSYQ